MSTSFITANGSMPSSASEDGPSVGPAHIRSLPEAELESVLQLFKLLADQTRLKILCFLMEQNELNVRTLCEILGQSQPAVSHHLALLRSAELVECRRDGKHNFYSVHSNRVQELLTAMFSASPARD